MIQQLHIARSLEKQVRLMRRSGRKAEFAVEQYNKILEDIRREGIQAEEVYCKRTKNGECRIRNCIKYDLGNGYRLITIRNGDSLFIPFLGGHDETDQWLNRHKNDDFENDNSAYITELPIDNVSDCTGEVCSTEASETRDDDPYEKMIMEDVDEMLLRTLFQGLYQKSTESE